MRLVSDLANAGTIQSLEELVANAWDADASKVWIEYKPSRDMFMVHDTGYGMNQEEIAAFYRLGDSMKASGEDEEYRTTPKGRRYMGKFGIGTISLTHLCERYELHTVKDATKITIREQFDGPLSNEKVIPMTVESFPDGQAGTKLVLRGLKFSEGVGDFTLAKLKRRLQWDFPNLPDFQIYFNGERVESRRLSNAQEYQFSIEGKRLGQAQCRLYVCARKTDFAGAYIYVNGRRVGDTRRLLQKSKIATRTVAEIHADGIEDAILFDRGRFREDHPGVVELEEGFAKALAKIEWEYRRERNRKKLASATPRAADVCNRQADVVNQVIAKNRREFDGLAKITIALGTVRGAASSAFVSDSGQLILDRNDPRFEVTRVLDESRYAADVLGEAIDQLVAFTCPDATIEEFLSAKRRVYALAMQHSQSSKVRESLKGISGPQTLSGFRMYEPKDVAKVTGRHFATYRRLIECGALPATDGKVRGEEVLAIEQEMEGYTPMYEIVLGRVGREALHNAYTSATEQLAHYGDVPFIKDVGINSSCFWIKDEFVSHLEKVMDDGQLDLRKRTISQHQPLQTFAEDLYLTLPGLVSHIGLTPIQVAQIIESDGSAFAIRSKKKRGAAQFSYVDVVNAARELQYIL